MKPIIIDTGRGRITALKLDREITATVLVRAPCPATVDPKVALAEALREAADKLEKGD